MTRREIYSHGDRASDRETRRQGDRYRVMVTRFQTELQGDKASYIETR